MKKPSLDIWLDEAKKEKNAEMCGMYLFHNGTVRSTPKADVRENAGTGLKVSALKFSYDNEKVEKAIEKCKALPGIYFVRVWLNQGELETGDDLMLVLIGGDIRPHVVDALQSLVSELKSECVKEEEVYG